MEIYWMIELDYFPDIDSTLKSCVCGANYCIPNKRKGPTILRPMSLMYQVVCLACNKHGEVAEDVKQAALYWNEDTRKVNTGLLLREWRKLHNYTQQDLANITGLANQTISDLETRKKQGLPSSRQRIFEATGIVL